MSDSTEEQHFDARFPARRKLIWFLTISFFLFLILFTAIEIENWRGRRAWKEFKQELEAKGEKLDFESLIPPPVPNESNFASVPFFTNIFDYYRDSDGKVVWRNTNILNETLFSFVGRTNWEDNPGFGYWITGRRFNVIDWGKYYRISNRPENADSNSVELLTEVEPAAREVLAALSKADSTLNDLYEASKRPFSRMPIHYEEGYFALTPHLAPLKQAILHLNLRASTQLALNDADSAARNVILSLRIANVSRDEPFFSSLQMAMTTIALNPLWEGLSDHQWEENHLKEFQDNLMKFDHLKTYALALKGQRSIADDILNLVVTNRAKENGLFYNSVRFALDLDSLEKFFSEKIKAVGFRVIPDGWMYQNRVFIGRAIQSMLEDVDHEARIVRVRSAKANASLQNRASRFPGNHMVDLLVPAGEKALIKAAFQQTAIDLATVACALERFRIAHGHYPDALDELSPRFIGKVPHDVINGEPLKYRRTNDGKFVVYSVGWNESDDGGIVAVTATGRSYRVEEGDWVWKFPTNFPAQNPSTNP